MAKLKPGPMLGYIREALKSDPTFKMHGSCSKHEAVQVDLEALGLPTSPSLSLPVTQLPHQATGPKKGHVAGGGGAP